MRLLSSVSTLLLLAGIVCAQAPVTAPFVENFDSEAQCPTAPLSPCPLTGSFTNLFVDDADWTADSNGTFSQGTGPSGDNTTGNGTYLYFETSTPTGQADFADVASPYMDVSGTTNPRLSFWYHMLGADMGTLSVDLNQRINEASDGITSPGATQGTFISASASFNAAVPGDRIVISGNPSGNGVYTIISIIDDNSVSVAPNFTSSDGPLNFTHERRFNAIPAFTDNQDLWQQVSLSLNSVLAPFGNGSTVQAIFRGVDGPGFTSDMAIDDFRFDDPQPDDVGPTSITAPDTSICPGDYAVSATISNFGTNPAAAFPLILLVDGAPVAAEVVNGPLAPGETISVTFQQLTTLTAGTPTLTVQTGLAGDAVAANDTISKVFDVSDISSYPYVEDFETGPAGWTISGVTSFAFGTPAQSVITGAASGQNAFGTGNLTGNYGNNEQGAVTSPCFNMTSLSEPYVRLSVWWEAEFDWDGGNLQYSTDGGQNWVTVGTVGDPFNWYTDNSVEAAPGGSTDGWSGRNQDVGGSGGWVTAIHPVTELAGATTVQFRVTFASDVQVTSNGIAFDDFEVFDLDLPFPGSGEDLVLETGVNGGDVNNFIGDEIKSVQLGDFLTIRTSSPLGTYVGTPYAFFVQPYATSAGPPAGINVGGFPEVHISASGLLVFDGNNEVAAGGLQYVIPPNGADLNYVALLPELSGTSLLMQSLVLDSMAANGFFAITDGMVFEIQ